MSKRQNVNFIAALVVVALISSVNAGDAIVGRESDATIRARVSSS